MATNKQRWGEDFPVRIGGAGGKVSRGGGFAANHELAVAAGRAGGKASRRRPGNEIPCLTCGQMFKTKITLSRHNTNVHTDKVVSPEHKSWFQRFGLK